MEVSTYAKACSNAACMISIASAACGLCAGRPE
jgi:hypothetical protein